MSDIADIAVCIGTYGDLDHWEHLVSTRSGPSVDRQTVRPTSYSRYHGPNLQEARNWAAETTIRHPQLTPRADWLCFLDADDELDDGYIEAMAAAAEGLEGDWLLQPATLGVYPDGRTDPHPIVIPAKPLLDGNFLVVSTLIRAEQFHRLGGFGHWEMYEDWDLWIRAHRDGANIKPVPDAVLRVHVNPDSRNNGDRAAQLRAYHAIRSQYR
jgi:GT2 family glycosyltransferase